MSDTSKQEKGKAGEDQAASYLVKAGYDILMRNARCRFGEIDIIAKRGDHLFFVEIKRRLNNRFGGAAEAVTKPKQEKIRRCAQYFLATRKAWTKFVPFFSVIAIDERQQTEVTFLPDAFQ